MESSNKNKLISIEDTSTNNQSGKLIDPNSNNINKFYTMGQNLDLPNCDDDGSDSDSDLSESGSEGMVKSKSNGNEEEKSSSGKGSQKS